jgi:hypothetical protein
MTPHLEDRVVSAERTYAMLGNETLWQMAKSCHDLLAEAHIPHAIAGGVAVCLHGYQRNTVDLDLLVPADRALAAREILQAAGMTWDDHQRELRSASGLAVQFLLSGERAGPGSDVRFPDPSKLDVVVEIEDLSVLSLAALIESKIASGQANVRRTHKDFADVVELIAVHELGRDFARNLHKSVRTAFRQLVLRARTTE